MMTTINKYVVGSDEKKKGKQKYNKKFITTIKMMKKVIMIIKMDQYQSLLKRVYQIILI